MLGRLLFRYFRGIQNPGGKQAYEGFYALQYTCKVCDTRDLKQFSKQAYHEGVVLIRCESCNKLHLVADNLGWFEDSKTNIEDIMKQKGEDIEKFVF